MNRCAPAERAMKSMDSARAEVAALQATLAASEARAAAAEAKVSDAQAQIAALTLMIEKLRRALYGRRSERKERLLGQLELELDELTASAAEDELAGETAARSIAKVKGFERRRPSRKPFSYNAAWRIRHKLMQVMMERDREHPLSGWIELDDAYLGGERSGGKRGRGAPGKTPFVAAVQTNEQGHPLRMKLTVVEGFRLTEIAAWAQLHLGTGTRVVSDGLACFHGVTAAGCVHESVVVGSGRAAVERPEFRWVNTILGNIKTALRGTYHAIRPKYAQRYLSEFEYRFNRRFDLPDIIPRLVYVALRTPPMPERLLKLRLA